MRIMSKKGKFVTCGIISFSVLIFLIVFMVKFLLFANETVAREPAYQLQRRLMTELHRDFNNFPDGDLPLDPYIAKIEEENEFLKTAAKEFIVQAQKNGISIRYTVIRKKDHAVVLQETWSVVENKTIR